MDKPRIELWNYSGLGLILLHETGVRYSNQTGGYACLHPEVEGAFVPLSDRLSTQHIELNQYFVGPKWGGWCFQGIDTETAEFIDGVLQGDRETEQLRVDRRRLDDSHEAWIYVNILPRADDEQRYPLFDGFPSGRGVLIWENSD